MLERESDRTSTRQRRGRQPQTIASQCVQEKKSIIIGRLCGIIKQYRMGSRDLSEEIKPDGVAV